VTCTRHTSEVTLRSSVVTPRTHGGAQLSDPPTGGQRLGPIWALWLEVATVTVAQSSVASRPQTGAGRTRVTAPCCCGYTPRRSGIGWVLQTRSRHAAYPGRVVCARTDRSGVGCSHREGCPLFPLLNASLRGWRDHYCDSADRWRDCARYKMSLTGQLVPITLLPNGHDAQLLRPDSGAGRSGAAEPRHVPGQAPPSRLDSEPPGTAVSIPRFEPAPASAGPLEPFPSAQVPQPESGPTSAPARLLEPSPLSPVPQSPGRPPARLTRRVRRAHGSTRRWWTRLSDWITGPA
jgi:hypothetical protein